MPRVNQALVEEEMRKLAEERTRSVAGDAPMLSIEAGGEDLEQIAVLGEDDADGRACSDRPVGAAEHGVPRAVVIWGLVKGV